MTDEIVCRKRRRSSGQKRRRCFDETAPRAKYTVEMPQPGKRTWCGCLSGEEEDEDDRPTDLCCMCGRHTGGYSEEPEVRRCDEDENWYAAMFSRKKDSTDRPERTSIRATPHVEEILNARDGAPRRRPDDDVRITNSGWSLIVLIGPMSYERVTRVCSMWSKSGQDGQRGMVAKVARGEAIANCMSVPGYVDWEKVFGESK